MLTLVRLSGPNKDEALTLNLPVIRLGRGRANDVAFDREKERVVSNNHAEIRLEQGNYVLYDLQSTHGSFVNGQKVTRTPLYEGDIIGFGQTMGGPTLRFSRRTSQTYAAPMPDDLEHTAYKASYTELPGFMPGADPASIPESTVAVRRSATPRGFPSNNQPPPSEAAPWQQPSTHAHEEPAPRVTARPMGVQPAVDDGDRLVHTVAHHAPDLRQVPGGLREETVAATGAAPAGQDPYGPSGVRTAPIDGRGSAQGQGTGGQHGPGQHGPGQHGPGQHGSGQLSPGQLNLGDDLPPYPGSNDYAYGPSSPTHGKVGVPAPGGASAAGMPGGIRPASTPNGDAHARSAPDGFAYQSEMFRNLGAVDQSGLWSQELSEPGGRVPGQGNRADTGAPRPGALMEDLAPPSKLGPQVQALKGQVQQLGRSLKPWFSLGGARWLFGAFRRWIKAGERAVPPESAQQSASAPAGGARPAPNNRQTGSSLRRVEALEVDEYGLRKPFVLEDAIKQRDSEARWSLPRFIITVGLLFGSPYIMYRYGEQIWHVFNHHPDDVVPVISGRPLDAPPIDPPGAANAELRQQVEELSRRQALLPPIPTSRAGRTLQFLRPVLHNLGEDVSFVPRDLVMAVRAEVAETVRRKDYLIRYRSMARYRPQIVEALKRANLPEGFSFIPWAVSGYQAELRDLENRRFGLWALPAEIAERHGLSTTQKRDERLDPKRSTDAAISYLLELVGEVRCQSFSLALASYQEGPKEARRLLTRQSTWRMDELNLWYFLREEYLPSEMQTFLIKVLAGAVIAENPEQFDLPQESDE